MPRDEAKGRAHRTRWVETWDLQDQWLPILIIFLTNCWVPTMLLLRPSSLTLQVLRSGNSKGLEGHGAAAWGTYKNLGVLMKKRVVGSRHQEDVCAFRREEET